MLSDSLRQEIHNLVTTHEVVLFMKGRRRMPQCGFSAQVVSILDQLVPDYQTVNVLERAELREGIKAFSEWPTIPQLYVKGQFVGGCDIVSEMFNRGELHALFGAKAPEVKVPAITVSDTAAAALKEALADGGPGAAIRLAFDAQFRPAMDIDAPKATDVCLEVNGIPLVLDPGSANRADGVSLDFVPGGSGGFKIENPNEPPKVRQLRPAELKEKMDAGEAFQLLDVRTPEERAIAAIPGAKLLDQSVAQELEALDRKTVLVFHCHHGGRSQQAAQHFLQRGFEKVYNLAGGIEAWSREVDPSVPRY